MSAAHAKPNTNAGSKKRLQERSLLLWRALAAAGPRGIGEPELLPKVASAFDKITMQKQLHSMQATGYTLRSGLPGCAVWTITRKTPIGEDMPLWQQEAADDDADDALDAPAGAADGKPAPGAVSSVFAVGDRALPPSWSKLKAPPSWGKLKSVVEEAQANGSRGRAEGSGVRSGLWRAPAGVAGAACVPASVLVSQSECSHAPAPAPAPEAAPAPKAEAQPAAASAPPPLPTTNPPPEPLFELHSDGMLVLDLADSEPEGLVVLPPRVTRALFRWLDVLGGTHLHRLVPKAQR